MSICIKGSTNLWTNGNKIDNDGIWIWPIDGSNFYPVSPDVYSFWAPGNVYLIIIKVRKRTKIRNRYNQVPHLTQDTNGKVTNSQLDSTNESQEVSPFPAGDLISSNLITLPSQLLFSTSS